MSIPESTYDQQTRRDPFAESRSASISARPRLLSYIGRWGRARRWLPADAMNLLDVGCSYGYGSAAVVARGPAGRSIIGIECDPDHLATARERFPWLRIIDADATDLPVASACVDAVLLLDVVEHIGAPAAVLAEARRVLRPGGVVIVSVPHRGPTRFLDGLNLYRALRARWPGLPELAAFNDADGGPHKHYSVAELKAVLGPSFEVDRIARTGIGLQELAMIAMLLIGIPLRSLNVRRVGIVLIPAHFLLYILDDLIPTGPLAYHLAIRARAIAGSA